MQQPPMIVPQCIHNQCQGLVLGLSIDLSTKTTPQEEHLLRFFLSFGQPDLIDEVNESIEWLIDIDEDYHQAR